MKTKYVALLALLVGASAWADTFLTVNDSFAGSGTLDLPNAVNSAENLQWPIVGNPIDNALFSASGQFPDGTAWARGNIQAVHFEDADNVFHYYIQIQLLNGSDSAAEFLWYERQANNFSAIENVSIQVSLNGNGNAFTPVSLPPGDISNGDLQFLITQSALEFPNSINVKTVPESGGIMGLFTIILMGMFLFRPKNVIYSMSSFHPPETPGN